MRRIGAALRGWLGHATSWLLQATTHRARARTLRLHTRTTPPRTLITHNLALRGVRVKVPTAHFERKYTSLARMDVSPPVTCTVRQRAARAV